MLRPRRDLVSYLMPLGIWQLNRLLGDGLTNCSKDFLKMLILEELRVSVSNLFHSRITETNKSESTFNSSLNTDYRHDCFNSHWHDCLTVTGIILQQSLTQLFNSYWQDYSTVTGIIL